MVFYGLGTHIPITLISNEELRLREVKSLHKDLLTHRGGAELSKQAY